MNRESGQLYLKDVGTLCDITNVLFPQLRVWWCFLGSFVCKKNRTKQIFAMSQEFTDRLEVLVVGGKHAESGFCKTCNFCLIWSLLNMVDVQGTMYNLQSKLRLVCSASLPSRCRCHSWRGEAPALQIYTWDDGFDVCFATQWEKQNGKIYRGSRVFFHYNAW